MTRVALSTRAGVSKNTLMKLEQGQTRDPGVLTVAALCRALSVSIDELVTEAQSINPLSEAPAMTYGIVSVGYEGRTIDGFVADLQEAGVQTVADVRPVSYTHLRAHETVLDLVCRLLLEKKKYTHYLTANGLISTYMKTNRLPYTVNDAI